MALSISIERPINAYVCVCVLMYASTAFNYTIQNFILHRYTQILSIYFHSESNSFRCWTMCILSSSLKLHFVGAKWSYQLLNFAIWKTYANNVCNSSKYCHFNSIYFHFGVDSIFGIWIFTNVDVRCRIYNSLFKIFVLIENVICCGSFKTTGKLTRVTTYRNHLSIQFGIVWINMFVTTFS